MSLIQEINKTITFYDENLAIDDKRVEKVVLVGGGSNLKGLVSYVALYLKKDVAQGDPWKNLRFKKQIPISRNDGKLWMVIDKLKVIKAE